MATKKTKTTNKTSNTTKSTQNKSGKRAKKFTLPHIEFSKLSVSVILLIAIGFLIFVCYEMHRLNDLSAVAYIGGGLIVCIGIVIHAYMKRAYQKDMVDLEIKKAKQLTAIKKKSGEDFVYDEIEDVTLTV